MIDCFLAKDANVSLGFFVFFDNSVVEKSARKPSRVPGGFWVLIKIADSSWMIPKRRASNLCW